MDPTCGLADKFRDLVLDQIWEQLLYPIYYHRNTEQLNQGLEELTDKRSSTQHRIDEARNNVEEIEQEVLHWLLKVDEILERAQQFRQEASEVETECGITSCPNPWLRYNLSKRAKAMAQQAAEICGKSNFDRVSYRLPPPSMPELPNGESHEGIDSREPIMNQIMEALRNPSVNVIGLCGLGGVGKTTIAKEVELKGKDQKMFEQVIWATVSDELNIGKIQRQIAEKLGMSLNEETEDVRACRLWKRLEQEKNMLLILDDLWEELDLRKVGIPFADVENYSKNNECCKILLTSRNQAVLSNRMKCQKLIKVDILSNDEALKLFKRINAKLSGGSSSPELISIATEIVQKCGGLPLAIVTAAKALQEKDVDGWKDYLARWKNHLRRNVTGIKEVDASLKLSYDPLSRENKNIFLLSAMLSHDPSVVDLLMYSVGLDFLQDIENMEEAHVGISDIVRKLKSLNLFLDSFSRHRFTIHDVFRDAALSIASDELCAFIMKYKMLKEWPDKSRLERCKGICLEETDISIKLPEELDAPRLQFFLLHNTKRDLTIPNTFFKSSKELKLLAFTNMHFLLLPSLSFLQKLKALCLHSCVLEDIAGVRSLKKLKVLSLAYSEIERLPVELAELTFLQMLNLSHCSKLKVIPQKLLSSLKKLEALYMENSFDQWKVEGFSEVNENVSLDELNDLPISSLDIHIPSVTMLPRNLFLDMNLKRYRILIGKHWQWWQCNHENSKMLRLELEKGIHLKRGVQKLLEGVEDLHLYGSSGLDNILFGDERRGFPCLRHLQIQNNEDIKCIVLNSTGHETPFPVLKSLVLQDLKALEKLCEGMNTIAFDELRTLWMENLPALTADPCLKDGATNYESNKMFRSLFGKMLLPKLEILELRNLNNSIPFIWDGQLSHNSLSNLKTLIVKECGFVKLLPLHVLKYLNNLEGLEIEDCVMLKMVFDFEDLNDHKEIELSSVVVPLKRLKLRSLPKLKNVWSNHYQGNVSFPSLRSVVVFNCESLTSIFPASFIVKGMLHNLEELRIVDCGIDVIVANDQASESSNVAFECPRLTSLRLSSLPKLRNLYPLEWSNLQRLVIKYCDGLEIFEKEVSGSFSRHEVEGTLNSNHPLSSGQALLPKLETWELCNLNNLIPFIWDDQLSHNSLSNLKTLIVQECGFVKLLPLHVLKSLNNLEELEIEQCRMLKMVFDFEDLNDYKGIESSLVVVPLKKLKLESLPKLENVWSSHYQGNVSFPSLRSVQVSNCQSLTNIFPASSIAKGMLRNLEELEIDECGIDVIVANDQASEFAIAAFKFPRLTSFKLYGLQKLRNFYPERHTVEWPNLQQLSIKYCALFEIFEREVSGSLVIHEEVMTLNSNHPLLSRDKVIYNFGKLRLTGKYAEMIGSGLFPICRFPNVKRLHLSVDDGKWPISYKSLWKSFPNLEKLKLNGDFEVALETDDVADFFSKLTLKFISNMRSLSPSLVSSQNLTHLQVSSSPELTTLMTSSTAQCLVHITHLSICYCYEMEEIITKQEGENDEDKEIIFGKLKVLQFDKMPRLKRFCGYNYTFIFPLLEQITITRCPTFKIFSPGNIDTPSLESVQLSRDLGEEHHEIWDTDLNKTLYKQRFVASREVVLDKEDASMIRNYQFPVESFPQVEILEIEGFVDDKWVTSLEIFPKLKQLHVKDCSFEQIFPSHAPSLASFHNLTELKVSECHQLMYLMTNSTAKSLVNLETLEISVCENLKEIVKKGINGNVEIESSSVVMPLKMLKLHRLPKLTNVWSSHNQGNVSLPSLRSVDVSNCESLTSIFPVSSIAKGMLPNLEELRIDRCGIDVIVATDQVSESATAAFKFPRLTTLELRRLRKLRNFYSQRHTLEWPNLQQLSIEDCGELEIFEKEVSGSLEIHEEESMQNSNHPLLSRDKVIPNLEELELRGEQAMISHPFPMYQFPKVKMLSLFLYDGSTISYKSLWKCFPNLEQLQLHGDFEEALETDDVAASFSTLTLSHIVNMRSLSPSLVSSPNLTYLQVTFCSQLTTLMTSSTAQCLVHLTYLSISYCDEMEEIITKQEGENDEDKKIIFNKLKVLKFDEMPRLKRFCGYNYNFRFPLLEKLVMNRCSKFKIFSPGLIDTPALKSVQLLEYWGGHNEIWDTNLSKTFNQQRFVASREVVLDKYDASMIKNDQFPVERCSQVQILDIEGFVEDEWLTFPYTLLERFPKLKQLHVKDCSFEQIFPSHAPSLASFHNLTALKVSKCHQLMYLVTNSTAKSLVNLQTLEISDCKKMEEIVKKESSGDVERGGIIFNGLRILKLDGLPRMKTEDFNIDDKAIGVGLRLLFDHNQVVLPKLEKLELSYLLNNSISLIWDEQLLHNSFGNLKMLIVQSCGSLKSVPIHVLKSLNKLEKLQVSECDMLEMVFSFEDLNDSKETLNLTHLEVESCQGLTTLMMSLAARRLAHLTHLSIRYCDQIKEIITKQEGDDEEDKEIVLSKLEILELIDLTRLKRFCSHNYTFSFSSLERTTIRECPQLTMFCPGVVHAPLLKSIQVENGFRHPTDIWMTDFNNTIQYWFTINEVISTTESMALNAENITMIKDVFPKVEALYVEGFMDEGVTFPYSSLERFPKLRELFVEHCSFEEIFPSHDHITNDFMEEIPPFEQLCIARLDKLRSIWKDGSQLPPFHQNLTSLEVESCCNLLKLAPSSASFQCLWEMKVSGCHQLIHLVTSSTAKSLVSLRRLEINDCKDMEAIVMNEINEDVEGKITFNRLWEIKLTDMPNLKMFSSQSHTLQFPKLYELKITGCPEMNMFCPGVLETPKLSEVKIEEHDMAWKDEGDINKTIKMLASVKEIVVNV